MEIDRGLEILDVVEATAVLLDPLDHGVDRFHPELVSPCVR